MPLRRPRLAALALGCLLPLSLTACGAPKGDPTLDEGNVNPGGGDGATDGGDGATDDASDGGSDAPIDEDGDGSPLGADCDDTDPARAPGLDDSLGDGVDQNCDGLDGVDADTIELLIRHGFRTVKDLTDAEPYELASILDVEEEDAAAAGEEEAEEDGTGAHAGEDEEGLAEAALAGGAVRLARPVDRTRASA